MKRFANGGSGRLRESLRKTLLMRPDLLEGREETAEEAEILEELAKERK